MDRAYTEALDIPSLARIAHVSPAHFIRTFRATFGETPHRYLQRRRVERAMFLLRETELSVTDVCMRVGFSSLGTFSRTFRDILGESPSAYRKRALPSVVPACFGMAYMRPASYPGGRREPAGAGGRAGEKPATAASPPGKPNRTASPSKEPASLSREPASLSKQPARRVKTAAPPRRITFGEASPVSPSLA